MTYTEGLIMASNAIGINPSALDTVIYSESKRNLKAVNPYSNATGLIQFMPDTAKELGTTIENIYNMGYEEQFNLIVQYFKKQMRYNNILTIDRDFDVYTLVFVPAYIGKPLDFVLPQKYYSQNKNAFDKEGKGFININDIKQRFEELHKYDYASFDDIAKNLPTYAGVLASEASTYVNENPKKVVLLMFFLLILIIYSLTK